MRRAPQRAPVSDHHDQRHPTHEHARRCKAPRIHHIVKGAAAADHETTYQQAEEGKRGQPVHCPLGLGEAQHAIDHECQYGAGGTRMDAELERSHLMHDGASLRGASIDIRGPERSLICVLAGISMRPRSWPGCLDELHTRAGCAAHDGAHAELADHRAARPREAVDMKDTGGRRMTTHGGRR